MVKKQASAYKSADNIYRLRNWLPLSYVFVISILTGLITLFNCRAWDDMGYSGIYANYIFGNADFPGLGPWFEFWKTHALYINGRLGDKFIPLLEATPQWFTGLCMAACTFGMMVYSAKLSIGEGWRRSYRTIVLSSLIILTLPWYDSGLMVCMLLNYQLTLSLALIWTWYYLYPPASSLRNITLIALLSFLVGAWHEGFSFLAFPALIFAQIIRKDRKSVTWIAIAFFALGILFIICNPSFWYRMGYVYGKDETPLTLMLFKASYSWPLVIVSFWFVLKKYILKRQCRYTDKDFILLAIAVALALGTTYLSTKIYPLWFRLWWFALLYSLVGWFVVLKDVKLNKYFNILVVVSCMFASIVNLVCSVYWQYLFKKDYDNVLSLYKESNDGKVYCDVHAAEEVPLICMRKVQRDIFASANNWDIACLNKKNKYLKLYPCELQSPQSAQLKPLATSKGFFKTKSGYLVQRLPDVEEFSYGTLHYLNSNGEEHTSRVLISNLGWESDSTLVYVCPYFHSFENSKSLVTPLYTELSAY